MLPTMAAIAVSAGAVVALYAVAYTSTSVVTRSTSADNMVVLARHSQTDLNSVVPLENLGAIKAAHGVVQSTSAPVVSAEYVGTIWLKDAEGGALKVARVRGIDPMAWQIHSRVRLASGRFPERGEGGVVVGRAMLNRFVDLTEHGVLHVGRHDWPVLGVLESGDAFESEIWCDRTAAMAEFHQDAVSAVFARVDSPQGGAEFAADIGRIKGLEAISEPELAERRMTWTGMDTHVWILRMLSLLLAAGAIVACLNALHGSLQSRLGEFATLRAIGYPRGRVLWLALQESAVISLGAAVMGLPLSLAVEGRTFLFGQSLFYQAHVDAGAIAVGLMMIILVALLSGVGAAAQVARMNVLATLRLG
jgi:putative ABC transport system permease protein